ncbi:MAG: hypothetical protein O3A82_17415 [Verrucomicrobia bacterium]|nr:hypothetical protein [Verrucomicrobiota bacterium]
MFTSLYSCKYSATAALTIVSGPRGSSLAILESHANVSKLCASLCVLKNFLYRFPADHTDNLQKALPAAIFASSLFMLIFIVSWVSVGVGFVIKTIASIVSIASSFFHPFFISFYAYFQLGVSWVSVGLSVL